MEIRWDKLIGHREQVRELTTLLREGRLPHALLFTGTAGIGKKLCGQILAAAILCGHDDAPCGVCDNCRAMAAGTHPDYYELAPEARNKSVTRYIDINAIREMQVVVSRSAVQAGRRVVLIDDAYAMNEPAANSLLKTLEEPVGQVTFILVTPERSGLLDTLVSRCMPLAFGPLPHDAIAEELRRRQVPSAEVENLACLADGSIGQALKLFQHDGLKLRENALTFLLALPEMNMSRLWAETAAREKMSRETLTEWAGYLNMLLRDMLLLYEDGASPLLYNGDLREKLVRLLTRFSKGSLFAMLRETRGFLHRLQANVNLRLQIEGYFIRLMDCR